MLFVNKMYVSRPCSELPVSWLPDPVALQAYVSPSPAERVTVVLRKVPVFQSKQATNCTFSIKTGWFLF